ncbi:MAG: hypothetical protein IPL61_27615 [Myxococcales bacterium]|nr:hypothetical protein [Myxococcales bacterium]
MTKQLIALMLSAATMGACKGDKPAAKSTAAAPGTAPTAPSADPVPAPGAAPAPDEDDPDEAPAAPDEAAAATDEAGDPSGCAAVVAHLSALAQTDAKAAAVFDPDKALGDCTSKRATASHLACLLQAGTIAEGAECDRAEFANVDVATAVGREFQAGQDSPEDKAGTEDGDYIVFRSSSSRKCGFLYREHHFAGAMFVMCADAIVSGALTTAAELRDVTRQLSDRQRAEHEVVKGIMDNYPYGRATRVYDQNGVYQGTRYSARSTQPRARAVDRGGTRPRRSRRPGGVDDHERAIETRTPGPAWPERGGRPWAMTSTSAAIRRRPTAAARAGRRRASAR